MTRVHQSDREDKRSQGKHIQRPRRAEVIESGVTRVWYNGMHLYAWVQGYSARDEPFEIH